MVYITSQAKTKRTKSDGKLNFHVLSIEKLITKNPLKLLSICTVLRESATAP